MNQIRQQRGVSAAELAKRSGVSRQTIYAIEAGDYVPNTALALQLAKILEVRVEDLFQLEGDAPAMPPPIAVDLISNHTSVGKGQPVQLCRVGKRMVGVSAMPQPLLPMADGVVVESASRAHPAEVQVFPNDFEESKRLLVAGCDPGISLVAQHLGRYNDVDMIMAPCSSRQALEWLKEGKVHVAGSHLRDTSTGEYNLPAIKKLFPQGGVTVVTFAVWEQGFVVAADNPKNVRAADDLARKGVRIMNREKGAGSRELLERLLREAGIDADRLEGYERIAYGHIPAALAVSVGEADCCIATRSAARAFGLSFVPLATERYDLVIRRQFSGLPAVEALVDTLNRVAVRRKLETLAGYDTRHTGETLIG